MGTTVVGVTTTQRCARHGRETRVSCSECGQPICPDCMVDTAVGIKCPACAAPSPAVRRVFRRGTARAFWAGALAGAALGALFSILAVPFFQGFITGLGVAESVLRFGGRRRGGAHLAAGLLGVVIAQLVMYLMRGFPLLSPTALIAALVVWFRLR